MNQLDARKYWSDRAEAYRDTIETEYHRNRVGMIDALLRDGDLSGHVVDFGCGDGVYAEKVLAAGGTVRAIDIDASMVDCTRTRLQALDPTATRFVAEEGDVTALESIASASVNTILALNVLAYVSPEVAKAFYQSASRILRPGGALVVTHSNELFDMFTLNRYTVAFFQRHFAMHDTMEEIGSLLTNPDKPQRFVFPYRENPLSYATTLAAFDLVEQQQEFSILHPLPPLLTRDFNPDDLEARQCVNTLDWPAEERWKLMFMCSVFGARAVKAG